MTSKISSVKLAFIPDARLVSGTLRISLDNDAVEPRVAAQSFEEHVVTLGAVLDASKNSHRGVGVDGVVKSHLIEVLHRNPAEDRPK